MFCNACVSYFREFGGRIVQDWRIEKKKILLAVSDNAYNIQNALSIQLNWRHFGCFAQTIDLTVEDGLKSTDVQQLISKVKIIVTHFRKSYFANEKLLIFQRQNGLNKTPLKLTNDVPVRWNSTFYMLDRFTKLETAVKSSIALIDKDLPILNSFEW
jgi:hypothetical protein